MCVQAVSTALEQELEKQALRLVVHKPVEEKPLMPAKRENLKARVRAVCVKWIWLQQDVHTP